MNAQAQSFRRILFTDLRHIQCGTLSWETPDGRRFGVVAGGPAVRGAEVFGMKVF